LCAGVGLLIALVGFVAFAGAAVAVWKVKAETDRRTGLLTAKAHEAVGAADHAVGFVRRVLDQAKHDLAQTRENTGAPPEPVNPFLQLTARQASQNLAGSVERADTAVVIASDAAVVAEAALALLGNEKGEQASALKQWLGVDPDQLARTQSDLRSATRELKQVRTLLGVSLGDGPTPDQLVTVESALSQAQSLTDQMGNVVATARSRVDETKRQVDLWVLRVALAVTAVGAVGAAGQVFMARYCWRVLRGKPA
jgi:hydrogenase maturation protease